MAAPGPPPRPARRWPLSKLGSHTAGSGGKDPRPERTTTRDNQVAWPEILARYLDDLEAWTKANQKDASRESMRFWALKIPAIVGAAATGLFGFYGLEVASLLLGGLAAACALVDVVNPAARLRNVHLTAVHELRSLQHVMVESWDVGAWRTSGVDEQLELASKIIESAEPERARIAKALAVAETRLDHDVPARPPESD